MFPPDRSRIEIFAVDDAAQGLSSSALLLHLVRLSPTFRQADDIVFQSSLGATYSALLPACQEEPAFLFESAKHFSDEAVWLQLRYVELSYFRQTGPALWRAVRSGVADRLDGLFEGVVQSRERVMLQRIGCTASVRSDSGGNLLVNR